MDLLSIPAALRPVALFAPSRIEDSLDDGRFIACFVTVLIHPIRRDARGILTCQGDELFSAMMSILLAAPHRLFPTFFRFIGNRNIGSFVGVLGEFFRGLADVVQLLFVTLAPTANQEMNALLDSHH